MSSVPNKKDVLMESQQYGYLSKSCTATLPADILPHKAILVATIKANGQVPLLIMVKTLLQQKK